MTWAGRTAGTAHGRLVHARRVIALANHFAALIPRDHAVLDVGAGDGRLDALILERRPDLTLTGVDVLIRPDARIPVVKFDGWQLPFPDRSFDTVMFCDVLHHTHDPVGMLHEAVRVARRAVVIKDHLVEGFMARPTLRLMDFVGNAPHGVPLPYHYFTRAEWDAAYRAAGLFVKTTRSRLGLYPRWADILFGRSLHFIACLEPL